jgi:hypothetical protein
VAIESRGLIVKKKTELAERWLKEEQGMTLGRAKQRGRKSQRDGDARAEGRKDGEKHNTEVNRKKKLGGA